MKDLETLLPMLREFLNERGLYDVKIELTLQNVPNVVIANTYLLTELKRYDSGLAIQNVKNRKLGKDTITLESKYF